MFTTENHAITRVKVRNGSSRTGQPLYAEFDFTDASVFHLPEGVPVWVDYRVGRVAEALKRDTDVTATMEIRQWSMDQITQAVSRQLRTGDLVKLNEAKLFPLDTQEKPETWFVLGEEEHEAGVFRSLPMRKFNLRRSDRRS